MNPSMRQQGLIALGLAVLMAITRGNHIATLDAAPAASWAVFFLAGVLLRSGWFFPLFLVQAFALDLAAVLWGGVSPACFSPAYAFLLPAYALLWWGGRLYARWHVEHWESLLTLVAAVSLSALACELVSSGSFYFLSGAFDETSWSAFWPRVWRYFPHNLKAMAFYVTAAAVVYALVRGLPQWLGAAGRKSP